MTGNAFVASRKDQYLETTQGDDFVQAQACGYAQRA